MQAHHKKDLFEFLSIPSISAQKRHAKDMLKTAKWLQNRLKKLGFTAKVLPTDGHPVVYGENLGAGLGKPTILVYGHYDVQSPDPLDDWKTEPFKPVIKKGNIYARGTADDKGQLYTWIAAIDELLKKDKKLPINVKFLVEGEEEVGSANLDKFVIKNKKLLSSDVCVISDSHALSENQPVIPYGLRGLTYTEISIKTLDADVHSGIYGGNVLNPANVLAHIISQLKDTNHKILIPGFYDKVRKLSTGEKKDLDKYPFHEKEVKEETGAQAVAGEKGFSVHARAGARPTLDVNGIWGGYQDEGPKTIIPAEAGAKISMRLVPYQDSRDIFKKFESYVRKVAPKGIKLEVKHLTYGEPIIMNRDSIFFQAAGKALKKTFGKAPVYELSGGSIPVTATLKTLLNMDSVLMGYGLPDDNLHSPNEKLSVKMFEKGIKTNIEFLKSL